MTHHSIMMDPGAGYKQDLIKLAVLVRHLIITS